MHQLQIIKYHNYSAEPGYGDHANSGFILEGFGNGGVWHPELKFVNVGIVEYIRRKFGVAALLLFFGKSP